METITITRGLVQLKLLRKRIDKASQRLEVVTVSTDPKARDLTAKEDLQSIHDLIERYNKIKREIDVSNATTTIKVAGETMLVIEAIARKTTIVMQSDVLRKIRHQLQEARYEVETANEQAQSRLDRLLEANYGKDTKVSETEIKGITDTFWKANLVELVDPAKIEEYIEKMDEYVDNFLAEVDLVLSESNSQTTIEI